MVDFLQLWPDLRRADSKRLAIEAHDSASLWLCSACEGNRQVNNETSVVKTPHSLLYVLQYYTFTCILWHECPRVCTPFLQLALAMLNFASASTKKKRNTHSSLFACKPRKHTCLPRAPFSIAAHARWCCTLPRPLHHKKTDDAVRNTKISTSVLFLPVQVRPRCNVGECGTNSIFNFAACLSMPRCHHFSDGRRTQVLMLATPLVYAHRLHRASLTFLVH